MLWLLAFVPDVSVADGAGAGVAAAPLRAVSALSSTASPLACACPSADTLISRLTIVPLLVVPFNTHAG